MANHSLRNITVHNKDLGGADIECDIISSTGVVVHVRRYVAGTTKAQLWSTLRAMSAAHEADVTAVPAVPVKEFDGWYDATKATPTLIADADKPVGLAAVVP